MVDVELSEVEAEFEGTGVQVLAPVISDDGRKTIEPLAQIDRRAGLPRSERSAASSARSAQATEKLAHVLGVGAALEAQRERSHSSLDDVARRCWPPWERT